MVCGCLWESIFSVYFGHWGIFGVSDTFTCLRTYIKYGPNSRNIKTHHASWMDQRFLRLQHPKPSGKKCDFPAPSMINCSSKQVAMLPTPQGYIQHISLGGCGLGSITDHISWILSVCLGFPDPWLVWNARKWSKKPAAKASVFGHLLGALVSPMANVGQHSLYGLKYAGPKIPKVGLPSFSRIYSMAMMAISVFRQICKSLMVDHPQAWVLNPRRAQLGKNPFLGAVEGQGAWNWSMFQWCSSVEVSPNINYVSPIIDLFVLYLKQNYTHR